MKKDAHYYDQQYNARAAIPDHPYIFTRWQKDSTQVRRRHAALLDLAYGDASGERLDFFPTSRSNAPLLVFIHGGWWRSLDKSDFSFVVPPYVTAGFNVALTNYTLAPQASIEDIVREQLRALAWLYRHAEHYDFDCKRIVIAGHSAGAHLAAMMMAADWPAYASDLPADLIKGAVLMSGLYDLEPVRHAEFVNVDLKLTPSSVANLSPAYMQPTRIIPFISGCGGLESDEFKRQTSLIGARWKAGHQGEIALPEANHLTICDAFASPDHPLCQATLKLLGS